MNKYLKLLLLGLLPWAIPFLASFMVWDVAANVPSISLPWFYTLMSFTGVIGFVLAAYPYFKNIKQNSVAEGWTVGIIWYIEMVLLDMIFLIWLMQMPLTDYYHVFFGYLNVIIMSATIGYLKK